MSPRPSSQSLIASARSGRARLRALLLGVLLAFGLGYAALLALGVDVSRQLWLAREALLGPESVGIWRDDERLGWAHVAGSQGRQRVVPDFDVTYHIDGEGHRQTPGAPTGEASAVLFLGGSFTFGHGVEDDQAYAARLQAALPEVRVLNAAVNAWGTAHALLKLEQELKQREDIQAVVYGFISHHTKRNYRRKVWLENLMRSRGRRAPMFAVEGKRLVFKGLADAERDGVEDSPELERIEVEMTGRMLQKIARLCRKREIPLLVAYLPDGSSGNLNLMLEHAVGAEQVIDLRALIPYEGLAFEHDVHWQPHGHQAVADALAPLLRERLEQQGE